MKYFSACLSVPSTALAWPTDGPAPSHVVDLGYAKHVPTWINTTAHGTKLLNYNNIRYAQPPLGNLRFRKPVVPPLRQHGIQVGNLSSWKTDCLSSAPVGVPFPLFNGSTWGSEDCLFLNVIVPEGTKPGDNLPVLHWVIGSAFAFGGKDWTGFGINTYGLYNQPLNLTDKFIIVTHNYRLGIAGWTPNLDADMDGNIGAWDSLAAIEWTKQHISRFGGDPTRITAIGQSAGATVLMYILLGQDGSLDLPFDQAWIASPTWPPRRDRARSRPVFDQLLNATGCPNVDCMRKVSQDTFRAANINLLVESPAGAGGGSLGPGVGLSPIVDGDLLKDLPVNAFAIGNFNKHMKQLVVGNTLHEGMGLSSDDDMPERFPVIVRANIPNIGYQTIADLQSLYSYPADLPQSLAWDFTTDIDWTTVVTNIAQAYRQIARRYLFAIEPAIHGLDISYLFFADNATTPVASIDVAHKAQHALLDFIFREKLLSGQGSDMTSALQRWPVYGDNSTVANITLNGFEIGPVPELTRRRSALINSLIKKTADGV